MKVTFKLLKDAYPFDPPMRTERSPCKQKDGSPAFENQCAIRMGVALTITKVLPASGTTGLARCWLGHTGMGHTLRAEELATWLATAAGFGAPAKFIGKAPEAGDQALPVIMSKTGVVFIKDFWGTGNQGDHIDVWNNSGMLSGEVDYLSFASQVWFWELP